MTGIFGFFAVIREAVTNLFRSPVTNLFPFVDSVPLPPNFRGAPKVDPENCTVCRVCERECPTHCITITEAGEESDRGDHFTHSILLAQCMFCGTCEEMCRFDAIHMTDTWLLANYTVEATRVDDTVFKKKKIMKEV
ncbi:MAG: 4Fe-4S binding protein [Candidatus Hodarchaeales archaeon]